MVRPAADREAVAYLKDRFQMSERRACSVIAADRKMTRYRSWRPPEAALRAKLRELANESRRFGYRRLIILLRQEGEASGFYRLYREEGLTVRKRRARRRAIGVRAPILVEAKVNVRWSLNFVHDQMASGRRFRTLNVIDDPGMPGSYSRHIDFGTAYGTGTDGRDRPPRQTRHDRVGQ